MSAGSNAVGVPDATGFTTSQALIINPGAANAETVTPTAVTLGQAAVGTITYTSSATGAGTATIVITLAGYPGSPISIPVAIGSTNTVTQSATATALAINSAAVALGIAPNVYGGGGALRARASPRRGRWSTRPRTGVCSIVASYPGTWGNSITLAASTTATTQTVAAVNPSGGTANSFTATFANAHAANEPVLAQITGNGNTLVAVPTVTNAIATSLVMVDTLNNGETRRANHEVVPGADACVCGRHESFRSGDPPGAVCGWPRDHLCGFTEPEVQESPGRSRTMT